MYYELINETKSSRTFAEVRGWKVRVYVVWQNGTLASAEMPREEAKSGEHVQFTDEFNGMGVWCFTADEFNALLERARK